MIQLEAIALPIYQEFVIKHFQEGEKKIMPEAIEKVYTTFRGVTLYMQRIMKDAYAMIPVGVTCDMALVDSLIDRMLDDTTKNREVGALQKVAKFLKAKKCMIITYDQEETITLKDLEIDVEVVPVYKYLLE